MDPIHPIVPVPPTIPPVTPAPMTGRVERDAARSRLDERGRRRRRQPSEPGADAPLDPEQSRPDDEDEPGLHVNVIA